VLHDFWVWVVRREKRRSKLEMPEFHEIHFNMEMKTTVSIDDQQAILAEVKRISWDNNPRIWLGIKLLSLYPRVRPGELLAVIKRGTLTNQKIGLSFRSQRKKNQILPSAPRTCRARLRNVPGDANCLFFQAFKIKIRCEDR
jgi:hypothetical protein